MRYILFFCFYQPFSIFAQSSLPQADQYFQNGKWAEAQKIYLSATGSLSAEQFYNLGMTYVKLKKNTESIGWLIKAAEMGNTSGMLILADSYGNGYGITKDTAKAFQWLLKAASKNDKVAMYFLGRYTYSGKWTAKNTNQAIIWLEASYKAGYTDAINMLAAVHYETMNDAAALKWLSMISDNPATLYYLGNVYRRQKGVPPNEHASVYYYYKALESKISSNIRDRIVDTLLGERTKGIDESVFKSRLNNILDEFVNSFNGVIGNRLISYRPGIYHRGVSGGLGSGGIDMESINGSLTFYEYTGLPYLKLPYIRTYKPFNPSSTDGEGLVFSGIIKHSEGSIRGEEIFDLYANLLKAAVPQFRFSAKNSKTVGKDILNATLSGEGTHKGKALFIDLKLRELGRLYYVELVVKNRRYMRTD